MYIREAHAANEWVTPDIRAAGIDVFQPGTDDERLQVAIAAVDDLGITIQTVVDGVDDEVGRAYGGWPDRLYVIGADGTVVMQGGVGPWGFDPDEVRTTLERLTRPNSPASTESAATDGTAQ